MINQFDLDLAVRRGMAISAIVDIDGVMNPKTGGFHVVQDALDAGHKSIFVRGGTHPGFVVNQDDTLIFAESHDAIIDGTIVSHGIEITAPNVTIKGLTAQTTAGGGQAYDAINISGTGDQSLIHDCHIPDCDQDAIHLVSAGNNCRIIANNIRGADRHGIYTDAKLTIVQGNSITSTGSTDIRVAGNSDNFNVHGNICQSTVAITVDSGATNGLVNDNTINAAVTDGGTGNTVTDNEVY